MTTQNDQSLVNVLRAQNGQPQQVAQQPVTMQTPAPTQPAVDVELQQMIALLPEPIRQSLPPNAGRDQVNQLLQGLGIPTQVAQAAAAVQQPVAQQPVMQQQPVAQPPAGTVAQQPVMQQQPVAQQAVQIPQTAPTQPQPEPEKPATTKGKGGKGGSTNRAPRITQDTRFKMLAACAEGGLMPDVARGYLALLQETFEAGK